jgi:hypothetical protein
MIHRCPQKIPMQACLLLKHVLQVNWPGLSIVQNVSGELNCRSAHLMKPPLLLGTANLLKVPNNSNEFITETDTIGASSAIRPNVGSWRSALSMTGLTCTMVDGCESTLIRSTSPKEAPWDVGMRSCR